MNRNILLWILVILNNFPCTMVNRSTEDCLRKSVSSDMPCVEFTGECEEKNFRVNITQDNKHYKRSLATCNLKVRCDKEILYSNGTKVKIFKQKNMENVQVCFNVTFKESSCKNLSIQVTYSGSTEVFVVPPEATLKPPVINNSLPWTEGGEKEEMQCMSEVDDIGWFKNGMRLVNFTDKRLIFYSVGRHLNGDVYKCFIYDGCGKSLESSEIQIQVEYGPESANLTWNKTLEKIICESDCLPQCRYNWTVDGVVKTSDSPVLQVNNNIQKTYRCTAFNDHGSAKSKEVKIGPEGPNIPVIIGAIVSGLIFLVILFILIVKAIRNRKKSQRGREESDVTNSVEDKSSDVPERIENDTIPSSLSEASQNSVPSFSKSTLSYGGQIKQENDEDAEKMEMFMRLVRKRGTDVFGEDEPFIGK